MGLDINRLPEAVIFDLDGLLINTDELIFDSLARLLGKYGRTLSSDEYGRVLGQSSALFFQKLFASVVPSLTMEDFWRTINSGYKPEDIRFKPGALELLQTLHGLGIPAAVATNSSKETFIRRTSHLGMYDLVRTVITAKAVENPKPAPDIYLKATQSLGVEPGLCLVLEDSEAGARAGYAAGCKVGFIPNPYLPDPNRLLISLPVALYKSLDDVRSQIFLQPA